MERSKNGFERRNRTVVLKISSNLKIKELKKAACSMLTAR